MKESVIIFQDVLNVVPICYTDRHRMLSSTLTSICDDKGTVPYLTRCYDRNKHEAAPG